MPKNMKALGPLDSSLLCLYNNLDLNLDRSFLGHAAQTANPSVTVTLIP